MKLPPVVRPEAVLHLPVVHHLEAVRESVHRGPYLKPATQPDKPAPVTQTRSHSRSNQPQSLSHSATQPFKPAPVTQPLSHSATQPLKPAPVTQPLSHSAVQTSPSHSATQPLSRSNQPQSLRHSSHSATQPLSRSNQPQSLRHLATQPFKPAPVTQPLSRVSEGLSV